MEKQKLDLVIQDCKRRLERGCPIGLNQMKDVDWSPEQLSQDEALRIAQLNWKTHLERFLAYALACRARED